MKTITFTVRVDDEDAGLIDGLYPVFRVKSTQENLHIAVAKRMGISAKVVDHADRNPTNNTRKNLRPATVSQNAMNRKKQNVANSTSKYKGVSKRGNKYVARIHVAKGELHLGTFDTELEAAQAYNDAAKVLFGEFAVMNNI